MNDEYLYNDIGYKHVSLHRRVLAFDPRSTDNPVILDYFNTIDSNRDNSSTYYNVLNKERIRNQTIDSPFPISFLSVFHDISISWVDIIHQMLFIDEAYATFVGEYKEIIENVIIHDNVTEKEALVYRYYNTGETMFHVAAKLWLFRKHLDNTAGRININMNEELKYILECYEELEWYFGEDRKFCILYLMDFNNKTLVDSLTEFVNKLNSSDKLE